MTNVSEISSEFSFEKEKAIAKSFSKRFQWEMILIGLGQATIWLSLWPLVINGFLNLWAGFLIASLCACFAYLPSHEAQHGNYSRGNSKLRWLDGLVGHITLITLKFPYHMLRITHMKHHAYTNNPEKDPDYLNAHTNSLLGVIKNVLDGSTLQFERYLDVFKDDKAFVNSFHRAIPLALFYKLAPLALVVIFPLETLLLWWLPAKLGSVYTTVFFSYYPHLGTSTAIEALKPFLQARGVPGADEIPDHVSYNPLIKI